MELKLDIKRSKLKYEDIKRYAEGVENALERLWSGKEEFTGWVKLPMNFDNEKLEKLLNIAALIQGQCEELIVIGIGGSYLGSRAVIHALSDTNEGYGSNIVKDSYPRIRFAGNNISATYLGSLVEDIRNKEVCLCVISKSGTTLEPAVAFAVLKDALINKYGKETANKRIYAITDGTKGALREEVNREGYTSFEIPEDVGGRFSVLTPVGLLPIAVAGIDIKELLAGAEAMATDTAWDFDATDYAVARYELFRLGKTIEIFEYYEPQLEYFAEWLKQLFGESEGKNGKGLFPADLQFSSDLHSMGQYLQEGNQIFFETILNVVNPCRDIIVPNHVNGEFAGHSMNEINKIAMEGVIAAHEKIGVPMIKIDIPYMDAFNMGQLIYFFETSCAISAYLMDVNPFNQPGVECYKEEMTKKLENIAK